MIRRDIPDMCTAEAQDMGCTCYVPHAGPQDIDPPEPKLDRDCPVHGDPDRYDRQRDQRRDDRLTGRGDD